jgi:hypothetical protein
MARKVPLNFTYALVTKGGKATLAFQSFLRELGTTVNTISDLGGDSDDITEGSTNKFISVADQTKLSGIETNATRDQSGAEIKSLYEAESDTNAFTDTEKSKLSGIEASADVTDAVNVEAAGALMDSEVDADIKTLSLPASTTISAFGASLVDDADAATARTTLGVDQAGWANLSGRKIALTATIQDISTAGQIYVVSPFAGDITNVYTVINGAIATADATITPKISGTSVTDGAVTVAFSGSAAGDVDSATPTAANSVSAGAAIEIETDGASTNTVQCVVTLEITLT